MNPKRLNAILFMAILCTTFPLQAQDIENWAANHGSITISEGQSPAYPDEALIHQQLSREVEQTVVAPAKSLVSSDSLAQNVVTLAIAAGVLLLAYLLFALLNQAGGAKATPMATHQARKATAAQQAA